MTEPGSAKKAAFDAAPAQGWKPVLLDEDARLDALEHAFDYRGDVTLRLRSGQVIEGFVFDRRVAESLADSVVRIMPRESNDRIDVAFDEIEELVFSGKDAAAGKTWERWVRTYVEKKRKGQSANLHPDWMNDDTP